MPADLDPPVPPPPGASWTGDWDVEHQDRIFGGEPIAVGSVAALLTGVQHRSGATVSGVALRVSGTVIGSGQQPVVADLTSEQARELAVALIALADRAEALDGIAPGGRARPT